MVIIGVAIGYLAQFQSPQKRLPTSTGIVKKPMGKMLRTMDVQIENVSGTPQNENQELILNGKIIMMTDAENDLFYQWVLPPGAEVVSGQISDSFQGVKANQVVTVELRLLGVSKESAGSVTLQAFTRFGDENLGGAAVFSAAEPSASASSSVGVQKLRTAEGSEKPLRIQQ